MDGTQQQSGTSRFRHFWRNALLFLPMLLLFGLSQNANASTPSGKYSPLFALSLEELVEIRVVGEESNQFDHDGIFLLNQGSFVSNLRHEIKNNHKQGAYGLNTTSSSTPVESTCQDGFSASIAIDGHSIVECADRREILKTLRYLGKNVSHIEVYRGESAKWWASRQDTIPTIVINIITKGDNSPDTASGLNNQREVADL